MEYFLNSFIVKDSDISVLIFIIPLVSAFIGWLTNYFAIKMLFHPRKKMKLLFMSLQGVIPANQDKIAEKLSHTISFSLLSEEELKQEILNNKKLDQVILAEIDKYIGSFLKSKVIEMIPMASMFLSDSLIQKVKNLLFDDLKKKIPELKIAMIDQALDQLDIKLLIQKKIENLSLEELENVLMGILKKEFKFVEVTGAIVGFFIGCLQLIIFYF